VDILILLGSLLLILLGAELFTNGIEWFGHKLNLAEGAVGSVLAAVATAMPETLIPVIAIVGPALRGEEGSASAEIGVGAILGAPFMLATLTMFVTGIAVIVSSRGARRSTRMNINVRVLSRDVLFFLGAYAVAIGSALIPPSLAPARWLVAAGLIGGYALYVRAHFADEAEGSEAGDLSPLHATRLPMLAARESGENELLPVDRPAGDGDVRVPRLRIVVAQVAVALALIVVGAQAFVGAVEHVALTIGIEAKILALIVAPIATELPEKLNSVLWVRVGKDTLALGNVTGAMAFQSCLPAVLGILLTDWTFGPGNVLAFASAGVAIVSTILIFGTMLRLGRLSAWTLLIGGPLYAAYVVAVLLLPSAVVRP
jgi:cation:H+ antiporter